MNGLREENRHHTTTFSPHSMSKDLKSIQEKRKAEIATWKAIVAEYQKPHLDRACWQIINTVFVYVLLWYPVDRGR